MNPTSGGKDKGFGQKNTKVVYSLADCEEGRVYGGAKTNNQFRYPSQDFDNNDTKDLKVKNQLDNSEMFRWHYADETDESPTLEKPALFSITESQEKNVQYQLAISEDSHPIFTQHHTKVKDSNNCHVSNPTEDCTKVQVEQKHPSVSNANHQSKSFAKLKFPFSKNNKQTKIKIIEPFLDDNQKHTCLESSLTRDYPHLSQQEEHLLKTGMDLYKIKQYNQAMRHYQEGKSLNPTAKEFLSLIPACEKKCKKKAEKERKNKKTNVDNQPSPSVCWSESVFDIKETLSPKHQYLLGQAEKSYILGDLLTSYEFCENGMELFPQIKTFKNARQKVYGAVIASLGIQSSSDGNEQKLVVRAHQYLHQCQYDKAIDQCKLITESVGEFRYEKKTEIHPSVLASAYSIMGKAFDYQGVHRKALSCHLHDLNISIKENLDDGKVRALTNSAHMYVKMKQFQKAILVWKQLLDLGLGDSEDSRICNEIGHCFLEIEDYKSATKYAEISLKTVSASNFNKHSENKLNASLLAAYAAMRSGSVIPSKTAFERALYYANEAGDNDAKTSIVKALEEIDAILEELSAETNC